jgi:hypothetical protein
MGTTKRKNRNSCVRKKTMSGNALVISAPPVLCSTAQLQYSMHASPGCALAEEDCRRPMSNCRPSPPALAAARTHAEVDRTTNGSASVEKLKGYRCTVANRYGYTVP